MISAAIPQKQNYRPGELTEAAGVSVRTVRRWLRLGLVGHVHFMGVIRIPREEYERVLREGIGKGNPVREGTR